MRRSLHFSLEGLRFLLPYWIGAALAAAAAVVFSLAFGWAETRGLAWFEAHPAWAFALFPLALLLSWLLAWRWAPWAAGSGIPQLVAAIELGDERQPLHRKLLGWPVLVVKFLGTCVAVVGGGITGREGPTLQISAGLFQAVQRRWPSISLQSMILAGGAAGLAAAFNTPLGGVVFAIEELAKVHVSRVRTYVFHAVVIAGLLAKGLLGNYLYIGRIELSSSSLGGVLALGAASLVIGGLGSAMGRAIVATLKWRAAQSFTRQFLMTLACGLFMATLFYFYRGEAFGGGRHVIVELLEGESAAPPALAWVRGIGNLVTYVGGIVGGVFAPALATGAAFGSWLSTYFDGASLQMWVLVGMTAFLTGLTRAPFTSLVLVLEMTDSHNGILELMGAAVLAQGAARAVDPVSFYEHMAHRILGSEQRSTPSA